MAPERASPRPRIIHTYSRKSPRTSIQTTPSLQKSTGFSKLRELVSGQSHAGSQNTPHTPINRQELPSVTPSDPRIGTTSSSPPYGIPSNRRLEELRGSRSTIPNTHPYNDNKVEKWGSPLDATPAINTPAGRHSVAKKRDLERTPEIKAARFAAYIQMKSSQARVDSSRLFRKGQKPPQPQRVLVVSASAPEGEKPSEDTAVPVRSSTAGELSAKQQQQYPSSLVESSSQSERRKRVVGDEMFEATPTKRHKLDRQESEDLEDYLKIARNNTMPSSSTNIQDIGIDFKPVDSLDAIEEYENKVITDLGMESNGEIESDRAVETEADEYPSPVQDRYEDTEPDQGIEIKEL